MKRQTKLGKRVLSFALAAALVAGSISVTSAAPTTDGSEAPISGAYNGTVSKVIGLKSRVNTETMTDNGQLVLRYNKKYTNMQLGYETPYVAIPNPSAYWGDQFKDGVHDGVYLYNNQYYYNSNVDETKSRVYFSDPIFFTGSDVAPVRDEATGMYAFNGKYYSDYNSTYNKTTEKYDYYFGLDDEVAILATIDVAVAPAGGTRTTYDVEEDLWDAAYEQFNANYSERRVKSTDPETGKISYNYYYYKSADGRFFDNFNSDYITRDTTAGTAKYIFWSYPTSEIATNYGLAEYDWSDITTSEVLTAPNGKRIQIGYEVEVDGAPYTDFSRMTSDGQHWFTTGTNWTSEKYIEAGASGEKIRVRAIYYTVTELKNVKFSRVNPDGSPKLYTSGSNAGKEMEPYNYNKYQYDFVKAGEWSEPVTAVNKAASALEIKAPTNLRAVKNAENPYKIDVMWDKVERANSYYVDWIMTTAPVPGMTIDKYNDMGTVKTDMQKTDKKFDYATGDATTAATKYTVTGFKNMPYVYFRVRVNEVIGEYAYESDEYYYLNQAVYLLDPVAIDATVYAPTVKLKLETDQSGNKKITWDPVNTTVYVYRYEQNTFPAYFNYSLYNFGNGYAPVTAGEDPDIDKADNIPTCTVKNVKYEDVIADKSEYVSYDEKTKYFRVHTKVYYTDPDTNTETSNYKNLYYLTATQDPNGTDLVLSNQIKLTVNVYNTASFANVMNYYDEGTYTLINKKVVRETVDGNSDGISLSDFDDMQYGKTYYYVAFTKDTLGNDVEKTPIVYNGYTFKFYDTLSAQSNILPAKQDIGTCDVTTSSNKTTVKLYMTGGFTGYEIYKKSGKKYKKLTATTDYFYIDEGLKADTEYSYKVRPYIYDPVKNIISYGEYVFVTATTVATPNSLMLRAAKNKAKQVKLTWKKLAKATKYEIYRTDELEEDPSSISYNNSPNKNKKTYTSKSKYRLIKTIKKAKTTSFTDKGLIAGKSYSYMIVATYPMGKKTCMIKDSAGVYLAAEAPAVRFDVSGDTAKLSWLKDVYVKNYQIQYKLKDSQGEYKSQNYTNKTVSGTSFSLKLNGGSVYIKIRSVDKKGRVSDWQSATLTTRMAAEKTVKATMATKKYADGTSRKVVKVTWKAVAGATYYNVYRSTKKPTYDADNKVYFANGAYIDKESNDDEGSESSRGYDDYYHVSESIVGTSAIDDSQKLYPGVKYYYTVVAYKLDGSIIASTSYGTSVAEIVFDLTIAKPTLKAKKGKVTVSWKKVTGNTGYTIYRSTKKGSGFTKIGTAKKNATKYVDKTAKKGKKYYYKVAVNVTTKLKSTGTATSAVSKVVKAK